MESNAGPRTLRTVLTVLGVLASVAVVAVASRGDISVGDDGERKPSETLIDVVFTLYLWPCSRSAPSSSSTSLRCKSG